MLEGFFDDKKSFIHMGMNTDLQETKKLLLRAKEECFTNILIHVETLFDIALEQCTNRSLIGERNEFLEKRIQQSCNDSLNVFNELYQNGSLVDFYVRVRRMKK